MTRDSEFEELNEEGFSTVPYRFNSAGEIIHGTRPSLQRSTWVCQIVNGEAITAPPVIFSLAEQSRVIIGTAGARNHPDGPADFVLEDNPGASRRHAELRLTKDGWTLTDLRSTNGTYLRRQRLAEPDHVLHDGDVFRIGSSLLVFREGRFEEEAIPQNLPTEQLSDPLASVSPAFLRTVATLKVVANREEPVLLLGETGTGKDVFANALHTLSGVSGEYVPVNLAELPGTLAAAKLFGARKGAFTGAESTDGALELAREGTLFLDEIGELDRDVQPSLLRVLENREFARLGESKTRRLTARVIAATLRDPTQHLRADLYARLKAFEIRLPRLSDRLDDFGLLMARFLEQCGATDVRFSADVLEELLFAPWTLNIRDLKTTIVQLTAVHSPGQYIERGALTALRGPKSAQPRTQPPENTPAATRPESVAPTDPEILELQLALFRTQFKAGLLAREKGLTVDALEKKLQRLGTTRVRLVDEARALALSRLRVGLADHNGSVRHAAQDVGISESIARRLIAKAVENGESFPVLKTKHGPASSLTLKQITSALSEHNGNLTRAASALGVSARSLDRRANALGSSIAALRAEFAGGGSAAK